MTACITTTSDVISVSPSTTIIPTTTTNVILTISSSPEHSSSGLMSRLSSSGISNFSGSGVIVKVAPDSISVSSHISSSTPYILKTTATIANTFSNTITPMTPPKGKVIHCNSN